MREIDINGSSATPKQPSSHPINREIASGSQLKSPILSMKDFRNLKVWEKAHELTLALHQITTSFPREEAYGLASQIHFAASSVPCNIAEGCDREGTAEFVRFCIITTGSASELEYQPLLARDPTLLQAADYEKLSKQYNWNNPLQGCQLRIFRAYVFSLILGLLALSWVVLRSLFVRAVQGNERLGDPHAAW